MIKKLFLRLTTVVLLTATAASAYSTSTVTAVTSSTGIPTDNGRTQQILLRLDEIKNMDKSALTNSERRDLRLEVKGMKKEMKHDGLGRGVYLSVGAIIIIILLLILIL